MQPTNYPPPLPPQLPSNRPPESGWKKAVGPLAGIGVLIAKFFGSLKVFLLPVLKFFPLLLKSGGSMLLTIGVYSAMWGWQFAVGFVVLLLVHECGHLVAAKQFGLKVGAPVFIPFMGAFIALKEAPRNAWIEAWVGIGGPILGSFGALVCHSAGEMLGQPLLIALGWVGYWLNLFNLTPIGQLDGGRIVQAISPWLWIPGVFIMLYMAITRPNLIIWLVLFMSIPRILSLFRSKSAEEQRFYEIEPAQRWMVAGAYFGLIALLVLGMEVADNELRHVHGRATQMAGTW